MAFKKGMAKVYGIGAAVVILGALFKIKHWPGADPMLIVGMGTEVLIFFISAFEPLHKEIDWSLVYPELAGIEDPNKKNSKAKGTISQQLDKMLEEAKVGPDLINSLGNGLKSLSDNVNNLKDLSSAAVATEEYTKNVNQASNSVQGLNSVYELEIAESNNHLKSINEFVGNLSKVVTALGDTREQAESFKGEIGKLSSNLQALNSVYGNMLAAMNVNAAGRN
jgi:DNA repair ATPase RecN